MSYITDVLQNNKFLKHFFLTGVKLDGEICFLSGTWQCKLHSEHYYITLINEVHINKIYILTLLWLFWENPGILGSMIIKYGANIKLNKVVYIKIAK